MSSDVEQKAKKIIDEGIMPTQEDYLYEKCTLLGTNSAKTEYDEEMIYAVAKSLGIDGDKDRVIEMFQVGKYLHQHEAERAEAEKKVKKEAAKHARKKKLIFIAVIVLAIAVVIALIVTQVVRPAQRRAVLEAAGLSADIKVGDTVKLGYYEQDNNKSNGKETIEWCVLRVEDDKILLISKYGLDCQKFNNSTSKGNDWESSDLKSWLQGTFASAAGLTKYSSSLTCLNYAEANETYFKYSEDRQCAPTAYAVAQGADQARYKTVDGTGPCKWWLCESGYVGTRYKTTPYVEFDGDTDKSVYVNEEGICVRPAVWINL